MKTVHYFIDKGNNQYESFYQYSIPGIDEDEVYARQLCTYFIKNNKQYELISNEMSADDEILVIKELGDNQRGPDELDYGPNTGIPIEFRKINDFQEHTYLTTRTGKNHWEVIRYLLKDYIDVPNHGQMRVSSTEIDEDRSCYVIYVKEI